MEDRDARRPSAEQDPDAAHRRAAFGSRPDDVPALPPRRHPLWLWGAGALVLLLLMLVPLAARLRDRGPGPDAASRSDSVTTTVAAGALGRDTAIASDTGSPSAGGAGASATQQFAEWVTGSAGQATPQDSLYVHLRVAHGLRLLADALTQAAGAANVDASAEITEVRARADRLQAEAPGTAPRAEHAQAAFVSAARAIGAVRARPADPAAASSGRSAPSAFDEQLAAAAAAIEPGRPLGPQIDAVRRYFRLAADLLR